eukprot:7935934-Lingulodinium_polyedra.AAC.1
MAADGTSSDGQQQVAMQTVQPDQTVWCAQPRGGTVAGREYFTGFCPLRTCPLYDASQACYDGTMLCSICRG